jgi:uncharacterized Rmd1/YagE family protein
MDDEIAEARFELLGDRIDHHDARLDALEEAKRAQTEQKQHRHGVRLEWIVIALVALEAAFEVLMYFHPHA